jgi:hypothetical protein
MAATPINSKPVFALELKSEIIEILKTLLVNLK